MVVIKVREAIRRVESDGWFKVEQEGSHRHYRHPTKKGKVTIAGKPSDDLPPKTWGNIRKQAGL